jgi:hypothetical protein
MTDHKNPGPVEQVSTDVADEMVRRLFADGGPDPTNASSSLASDMVSSLTLSPGTVIGMVLSFPKRSLWRRGRALLERYENDLTNHRLKFDISIFLLVYPTLESSITFWATLR